jgi:hypothetical protein
MDVSMNEAHSLCSCAVWTATIRVKVVICTCLLRLVLFVGVSFVGVSFARI